MVNLEDTSTAGAEQQLTELGIALPSPPTPFGNYVEGVRIGRLLYLSGMLPVIDRKPQAIGRLGAELTVDEGRRAAETATLSDLSAISGKSLSSFACHEQRLNTGHTFLMTTDELASAKVMRKVGFAPAFFVLSALAAFLHA
ncbi:RidA family protein [Ensifer adhaerens]|uniref:RidA family protein n=1 Tax=Ensifer adhaerens TaxID=106592 RepID=UPI003D011D1F